MQLSDSGVYTCLARNLAGLAELNFDVQVQGNFQTLVLVAEVRTNIVQIRESGEIRDI